MCVRMTTLLCVTLLLAACDAGLGITVPQSDDSTRLNFEMVKLQQQGGPDCPEPMSEADKAEAGADNVESGATAEVPNSLCATVTFSYPQLSSDAKPELAEQLNSFILQQMVDNPDTGSAEAATTPQQFAEAFINEYQQTPNPFNSWELERSLKIAFVTQDALTLLFEEYGYTGGAHPFSGSRYSMLSLADASQIILPDLLNPGYETALNVAAEKIFRQARNLKEEETLEEQGFSFPNNVFSVNDNFGILKEGLDFIFNPYEIAPYALGPTQFLVPYEDIQELIRPDGPLGKSASQPLN